MECEQAVCKMVVGSVEGHMRGTEEGPSGVPCPSPQAF